MSVENISEKFTLKGELFWPAFTTVNEKSEKFQVDLKVDEDSKAELELKGVALRNEGDDRGDFVRLKSLSPPKVVDGQKKPFELPDGVLIGNGSKAIVVTHTYDWTDPKSKKGKKGRSLGLNTVQILDLVEYKLERKGPKDLDLLQTLENDESPF